MQAQEGLMPVHRSCQPPVGLLVCPPPLSPHGEATAASLALAISEDGTTHLSLASLGLQGEGKKTRHASGFSFTRKTWLDLCKDVGQQGGQGEGRETCQSQAIAVIPKMCLASTFVIR